MYGLFAVLHEYATTAASIAAPCTIGCLLLVGLASIRRAFCDAELRTFLMAKAVSQ